LCEGNRGVARDVKAVIRFVLDAAYITIFFVVTLALSAGADRLVDLLTSAHVDGIIVGMVKWLARGLAAFDVIGVGIAGAVSLFRFVRALIEEASHDGGTK
jgi:hypothetical protein